MNLKRAKFRKSQKGQKAFAKAKAKRKETYESSFKSIQSEADKIRRNILAEPIGESLRKRGN